MLSKNVNSASNYYQGYCSYRTINNDFNLLLSKIFMSLLLFAIIIILLLYAKYKKYEYNI